MIQTSIVRVSFVYIPFAGKPVTPRLNSFMIACAISSGFSVIMRNSTADVKPLVNDSFVLLSMYDSNAARITGNKSAP